MRILLFVVYIAGRGGRIRGRARRWLIDRRNAVWTSERKRGVAELGADALANGDYVATAFDAVDEDLADYTFRVRR